MNVYEIEVSADRYERGESTGRERLGREIVIAKDTEVAMAWAFSQATSSTEGDDGQAIEWKHPRLEHLERLYTALPVAGE